MGEGIGVGNEQTTHIKEVGSLKDEKRETYFFHDNAFAFECIILGRKPDTSGTEAKARNFLNRTPPCQGTPFVQCDSPKYLTPPPQSPSELKKKNPLETFVKILKMNGTCGGPIIPLGH